MLRDFRGGYHMTFCFQKSRKKRRRLSEPWKNGSKIGVLVKFIWANSVSLFLPVKSGLDIIWGQAWGQRFCDVYIASHGWTFLSYKSKPKHVNQLSEEGWGGCTSVHESLVLWYVMWYPVFFPTCFLHVNLCQSVWSRRFWPVVFVVKKERASLDVFSVLLDFHRPGIGRLLWCLNISEIFRNLHDFPPTKYLQHQTLKLVTKWCSRNL